jgi:hypothetical protein
MAVEQKKQLPQGGQGSPLVQKSLRVLVGALFILGSCTFLAVASEQAVSYFNELECFGLP